MRTQWQTQFEAVRAVSTLVFVCIVFVLTSKYYFLLVCVCVRVFMLFLPRSVVATETFKLPLRVVQFAFEKMEHERDVDEIECLLANLIFRVRESVRTCWKIRFEYAPAFRQHTALRRLTTR